MWGEGREGGILTISKGKIDYERHSDEVETERESARERL